MKLTHTMYGDVATRLNPDEFDVIRALPNGAELEAINTDVANKMASEMNAYAPQYEAFLGFVRDGRTMDDAATPSGKDSALAN